MLLYSSLVFYYTDLVFIYFYSKSFKASIKYFNKFRLNYFFKQISWAFYKTNNKKIKLTIKNNYNHYFIGLKAIWFSFRYWFIGLIFSFLIFFYFLQIKSIPFNKTIFGYFIVSVFFY